MRIAEFVVEGTFESCGRGYVVARIVDPTADFVVSPAATLGGFPVESWVDMPRARDRDGQPRLDVFGFCLRNLEARTRLRPGDRVALT